MSSQEINYIKNLSQKAETKEKRGLYKQALNFLNSPKIKNLPFEEYDKKVREILQILKNKEKELLKQQTANKIDFLKLSMEIENQQKERMFKNIEQEINTTLSSLREFNETKNQSNAFVKSADILASKVAGGFGYQGVAETLEMQYKKRKESTINLYKNYKKKIDSGEIKLNKQEKEDFNKLEQTILAIGTTEFKMIGKTSKEQKKKVTNPDKKAGRKVDELNIFLAEKGIKYSEIKGKKSNEIIPLLKSKKLSQDDISYVLQNYGGAKKEAKEEASKKIKDKGQLAEAERLIGEGLSFSEVKEVMKKRNKPIISKSNNVTEDYSPIPKTTIKQTENKSQSQKIEEQTKITLNPSIETQITSSRPLDLGIISNLNRDERKKVFDMVFENIDKTGHSKKLITNGIEFNLSGTKGNYEVRYGDRVITGLSREKVKESISFAKFLKPIGLDFLIGNASRVIARINETSTKGLQVNDADGMNILEQDLCFEKLGKAILNDSYKHSPILSENKEQFTRIKSNPIKYNNSNFSSLELLAKEKFNSGGNEINIDKLLSSIS